MPSTTRPDGLLCRWCESRIYRVSDHGGERFLDGAGGDRCPGLRRVELYHAPLVELGRHRAPDEAPFIGASCRYGKHHECPTRRLGQGRCGCECHHRAMAS